ncbi:MAG TPA: type II toxin-antitoxin system VapC family toxin [Meiothermus sp.]|nr:type II toxin-antitoxin system VapC family toxin [Meiothermus sp.]
MVIDASALLAFWQREAGAEVVAKALEEEAFLSTVTYTEVVGKLVGAGEPANQVEAKIGALALQILAFDEEQAQIAAFFYARRKPYNLSFGDCAALALGEHLDMPVLTAEQHWAKLPNLRVKIKLIR